MRANDKLRNVLVVMPHMEHLAYFVKQIVPSLFCMIEAVARGVFVARFGRRIIAAERDSSVEGVINNRTAQMRQLCLGGVTDLKQRLDNLPSAWLKYFKPHSFEKYGLISVVKSLAFFYFGGLFVDGRPQGYALLKIRPTGSAFIGLLVHPDLSGLGVERFIVGHLYWQASLAGLRTRSTISKSNTASVRSHRAVFNYTVVAALPNDYIMIEFPFEARSRPELQTR